MSGVRGSPPHHQDAQRETENDISTDEDQQPGRRRSRVKKSRWRRGFEPILGHNDGSDFDDSAGSGSASPQAFSHGYDTSDSGEDSTEHTGVTYGERHRPTTSTSSASTGRQSINGRKRTAGASGPNARAMQRNLEHIRKLEEQNRRKREARELAKSVGTKLKEERRRNFNLNFAGANKALAVKRNQKVREASSRHRKRIQKQRRQRRSSAKQRARGRHARVSKRDSARSDSSEDDANILREHIARRSTVGVNAGAAQQMSQSQISLSLDATKVRGEQDGRSETASALTLEPVDGAHLTQTASKTKEVGAGADADATYSEDFDEHDEADDSSSDDSGEGSVSFMLDFASELNLEDALNREELEALNLDHKGESSEEMDVLTSMQSDEDSTNVKLGGESQHPGPGSVEISIEKRQDTDAEPRHSVTADVINDSQDFSCEGDEQPQLNRLRTVMHNVVDGMDFESLTRLLNVLVCSKDDVGSGPMSTALRALLPIDTLPMEAFEFVTNAVDATSPKDVEGELMVKPSASESTSKGANQKTAVMRKAKILFSTLRIAAGGASRTAAAAAASARNKNRAPKIKQRLSASLNSAKSSNSGAATTSSHSSHDSPSIRLRRLLDSQTSQTQDMNSLRQMMQSLQAEPSAIEAPGSGSGSGSGSKRNSGGLATCLETQDDDNAPRQRPMQTPTNSGVADTKSKPGAVAAAAAASAHQQHSSKRSKTPGKAAAKPQFLFKSLKLKTSRQPTTRNKVSGPQNMFEDSMSNSYSRSHSPNRLATEFSNINPDDDPAMLSMEPNNNLAVRTGEHNSGGNAVVQPGDELPASQSSGQKRALTPDLPAGTVLKIALCSNWGDPRLVGLTALELFDERGNLIKHDQFSMSLLTAEGVPHPAAGVAQSQKHQIVHHHFSRSLSQSTLASTSGPMADDRTGASSDVEAIPLERLFDGGNFTCDPHRMWSTEHHFQSTTSPADDAETSKHHEPGCSTLPRDAIIICITFARRVALSIVRVWNFNTSRVGSSCGVRGIRLLLDDIEIFRGEVPQASGQLTRALDSCGTVLLTKREAILQHIMRQDHRLSRVARIARPPEPMESRIEPVSPGIVESSRSAAQIQHHKTLRRSESGDGVTAALQECQNEYEVGDIHRGTTRASKFKPSFEQGVEGESNDNEKNISRPSSSSSEAAHESDRFPGDLRTSPDRAINFGADPNDTATVSLVKTIMGRVHKQRPITGSSTSVTRGRSGSEDSQASASPFSTAGFSNESSVKARLHRKQQEKLNSLLSQGAPSRESPPRHPSSTTGANVPRRRRGRRGLEMSPEKRPQTSPSVHRAESETDMLTSPVLCTCASLSSFIGGSRLILNFTSTWGDQELIGLTGIEVFVFGNHGALARAAAQQARTPSRVTPQGRTLSIIRVEPVDVRASADLNSLSVMRGAYRRDPRTADKLLDGCNVTTKGRHMWLAPFGEGGSHTITLDLPLVHGRPPVVACLRLWNYNKNVSDSFRGARAMSVTLDGCTISPDVGEHFVVRKAPGVSKFDFGQLIWLQRPCTMHHQHLMHASAITSGEDVPEYLVPALAPQLRRAHKGNLQSLELPPRRSLPFVIRSFYDTTQPPRGFVFKLRLYSTINDPYYVGLDGVYFYALKPDSSHPRSHDPSVPQSLAGTLSKLSTTYRERLVPVFPEVVEANPRDINILAKREDIDPMDKDGRVPENLVDGFHGGTFEGTRSWLAPRAATLAMMKHELPDLGACNEVYFAFHEEVELAAIEIWNYSKTPERGAHEIELRVDDHIIYCGDLLPSDDLALKEHEDLVTEWDCKVDRQNVDAHTKSGRPTRRRSLVRSTSSNFASHDNLSPVAPPGQIIFFNSLAQELSSTPAILQAAASMKPEQRQALLFADTTVKSQTKHVKSMSPLSATVAPEQNVTFFDEGVVKLSDKDKRKRQRPNLQNQSTITPVMRGHPTDHVAGATLEGITPLAHSSSHQHGIRHGSSFGYGVYVDMAARPTTSVLGNSNKT